MSFDKEADSLRQPSWASDQTRYTKTRMPEEFFSGHEHSQEVFELVHQAIEQIGSANLYVWKSKIIFRRSTISTFDVKR